jgi:hypothetical protein
VLWRSQSAHKSAWNACFENKNPVGGRSTDPSYSSRDSRRSLSAMEKLVTGDRPDSAKNDPNHPGHSAYMMYLNYTSARR